MSDFKWDKDKFGDSSAEVEALVNQAIAFGTKQKARELETEHKDKIESFSKQLKEYQNKITGYELENVPEENKTLVTKLMSESSLDDVKKQFPHLFKSNVPSTEDLLNNKQMTWTEEEKRVLEKEKANQLLTDEEKVLWSQAILKTQ